MPYANIISRTDAAALITEQVSDVMMRGITQQSAAIQLFRNVPVGTNATRVPLASALPTAYWVNPTDVGLKQTTETNWTSAYLYIEELAAIVVIPNSVLDDSSVDILGMIEPQLIEAVAIAFDAAVFFGTNAPASFPDDLTTAATAAGNVAVRGTAAGTAGGIAEDINQLLGTLEADGYVATGIVANPTMKARLRGARDSTGQLLLDVNGGTANVWGIPTVYPMGIGWPAAVSSPEAFALQRENFLVGIRQDFTVTVHTEGVITDAAALVTYNLMQQDLTAVRVVFRAGWVAGNPVNRAQPTEANRYPAAVLTSPAS
ncbi:MAG TPA: phage major capsid protein [Tepidisphaeraceae bacterium]